MAVEDMPNTGDVEIGVVAVSAPGVTGVADGGVPGGVVAIKYPQSILYNYFLNKKVGNLIAHFIIFYLFLLVHPLIVLSIFL